MQIPAAMERARKKARLEEVAKEAAAGGSTLMTRILEQVCLRTGRFVYWQQVCRVN